MESGARPLDVSNTMPEPTCASANPTTGNFASCPHSVQLYSISLVRSGRSDHFRIRHFLMSNDVIDLRLGAKRFPGPTAVTFQDQKAPETSRKTPAGNQPHYENRM